MEQKKRTTARKSKKKNDVNMLMAALVIATGIHMVYRILLSHLLGDLGNGYFTITLSFLIFLTCIVNAGIPHVLSKLLITRFSKNLWKNAKKIFLVATLISMIISCILLGGVEVFAMQLSEVMFGQPLLRISLQFMIPAFVILTLTQLLRGYFQGFGTKVPTAVSLVLEQIVLTISSLLCMYGFYQKGKKVGAFLHNDNYASSFGAAGAAIGMIIGGLVTLAFLGLIFIPQCKNMKKMSARDTTIRVESLLSTIRIWISAYLPICVCFILIGGARFFDVLLLQRTMVDNGKNDVAAVQWGLYAGKVQILLLLPNILAFIGFLRAYLATQNKYHKDEIPYIKEQIAYRMRMAVLPSVLFAGIYIGFAKTIVDFTFTGERVLTIQMLQYNSMSIIFTAISAISLGCLYGTDNKTIIIRNSLIYTLLHMISTYLFVTVTEFDILGVIYAEVLSSIIFCVFNVWSLQKTLRYRQEYIETYLKPIIAGIIVGVILTLLQLIFGNMFPGLALLIGLIVSIPGYFVALSTLKVIKEKDFTYGPSGVKLIMILRKCRLIP